MLFLNNIFSDLFLSTEKPRQLPTFSVFFASDLIVAPNRDTYFDIGIIQALSLDKPILTTDTGGNSWFKDKDLNIYFADCCNLKSFVDIIKNTPIYSNVPKNKLFFEQNLNVDNFALNYNKVYDDILGAS
jgi:glycosyltransferase involved in cell wall biosynthesis